MKYALRFLVGSVVGALALAQSTERLSLDSTGAQLDNWSGEGSMTPDGRFVLFTSAAANLGASASLSLAFVRDRTSGATSLVSVATSGALPDRSAEAIGISADARYVLFKSDATNLGADSPGLELDLFVHDRQSGATSFVAVNSSGVVANAGTSAGALSANGRFVVFSSRASNLVLGDTNESEDVFVRDLQTSTTTRVSVDSAGSQANSHSMHPALSADGRFVAFASYATNLNTGHTNNGFTDIFVHDRQTGQTTYVSLHDSSAQASGGGSRYPAISADGQRVAFTSDAALVSNDTNGRSDLYVRDLQTARTIRATVSSSGLQLQATFSTGTTGGWLSPDGNYVAFASIDNGLVPNDTIPNYDGFLHEISTGQTTLVNVDSHGIQGYFSYPPKVATGRLVVFGSLSQNLVAGDTNAVADVFVRDRGPGQITPFCAGDGSLFTCPCGNNGTARRGCATSYSPLAANGAKGAYLGGYGSPVASADSLFLQAEQLTGDIAIFYQGDAQQSPTIVDDGISCVGGSIVRLATKGIVLTNSVRVAQYPQSGDLPITIKGSIPAGGGTRYYQVWYRHDEPSFCPPATTNRTNGLIVFWAP